MVIRYLIRGNPTPDLQPALHLMYPTSPIQTEGALYQTEQCTVNVAAVADAAFRCVCCPLLTAVSASGNHAPAAAA